MKLNIETKKLAGFMKYFRGFGGGSTAFEKVVINVENRSLQIISYLFGVQVKYVVSVDTEGTYTAQISKNFLDLLNTIKSDQFLIELKDKFVTIKDGKSSAKIMTISDDNYVLIDTSKTKRLCKIDIANWHGASFVSHKDKANKLANVKLVGEGNRIKCYSTSGSNMFFCKTEAIINDSFDFLISRDNFYFIEKLLFENIELGIKDNVLVVLKDNIEFCCPLISHEYPDKSIDSLIGLKRIDIAKVNANDIKGALSKLRIFEVNSVCMSVGDNEFCLASSEAEGGVINEYMECEGMLKNFVENYSFESIYNTLSCFSESDLVFSYIGLPSMPDRKALCITGDFNKVVLIAPLR